MSKSTTPLTNAERQRRHKQSSPRPRMSAYVSRWVQAAVDEEAESRKVSTSQVWEEAGDAFTGCPNVLTLTTRGAKLLGHCTACKRKLEQGDRVRRDGEFARHEDCK